MSEQSRTSQDPITSMDIDQIASEIQRGRFQGPTFFGDNSISQAFSNFSGGASAGAGYAGGINILRNSLVEERDPDSEQYYLTNAEFALLQKRAKSVSNYANIPYDVAEDFLLILCLVDKIDDMKKISDAVEMPLLNDPDILRQPEQILNLPKLENLAFIASAIEGLVNMFRKYLNTRSSGGFSGELPTSILSGLNISGFDHLIEGGSPGSLVGNFLSEQITGNRIPMSVISKNPTLLSPSYAGKAFFGESATPLSLVDIDQVLNKRLAVFPTPSNGAGTTSFGLQNSSSFSNEMNIQDLVSTMIFGSINTSTGTAKERMLGGIMDTINSNLGTTSSEVVDVRRADTAIPVITEVSSAQSGSDNAPFSIDTFSQGWLKSNGVSNFLNMSNNPFMEAYKRFS